MPSKQTLRLRKPVAAMIDEAQHLGKVASGRRLLDQLDVIKSIANRHLRPYSGAAMALSASVSSRLTLYRRFNVTRSFPRF
jgi:hypothetical protein